MTSTETSDRTRWMALYVLCVMCFPQGLTRLAQWKARIGGLPLIAIGGITPDRADGVMAAGADSVAVITDFFTNPDPSARVRQWLAWAERCRARH